MSAEPELPDPDIPQDPGIPGTKTPEQLPPQQEPDVEGVPDSGPPDVDEEGNMAPAEPGTRRVALVSCRGSQSTR
jgi:hypothetical protein